MTSSAHLSIKNPTKEGWLTKKSRHLKKWRRRWVVLEGSILHTYKKEQCYKHSTEVIDLKIFSSVKSSEDQTHKEFSFDVYSPESRFSFCARTEGEKEDWIRHIGKAIVLTNRGVHHCILSFFHFILCVCMCFLQSYQKEILIYDNPMEQ